MATKQKTNAFFEHNYSSRDFDKSSEIALFYGFRPVRSPKIEKVDLEHANSIAPNKAEITKKAFPRPEEKVSLLRNFLLSGQQNPMSPVMFHYKRPVVELSIRRQTDECHYSLDIIGSESSVSEAIAIRTAAAILAEHGHKDIVVDINSLGDKDSIGHFVKDLTNFVRKHGQNMPPEVRQQLKKDPFEVWNCRHEKWLEVRNRAPQALNFLTEKSTEHFREILEYLETFEIPYRINHSLIGNRNYCSHTIFEIKNQSEPSDNDSNQENILAIGTRHNYMARRIGFKREVPVFSVNLNFKKPASQPKMFLNSKAQPKFFFVQFGSFARLKSLSVIESLRQARIPVHHLLTSDKLANQMSSAETLKVPFVIIMGQKEALENTVVVRHVPTRSQEIVTVPELARYLSKIR